MWHRVALQLEQIAFDGGNGSHPTPSSSKKSASADGDDSFGGGGAGPLSLRPQQEAMDALSELYSLLREEDMWAGLWQKKAKYAETNIAIAYEQQGFYEQSQVGYESEFSFILHVHDLKLFWSTQNWFAWLLHHSNC